MAGRIAQRRGAVGGVDDDFGRTRAQRLHERGERRQLHGQELRVVVGGREMGHRAGQPQPVPARVGDPVGDRQRFGGRARAEPAHPRVELDVYARPAGSAVGDQDRRRTARPRRRPRRRRQAPPAAPRALSAPSTSSGASIPSSRSCTGLAGGRDRQHRRAAGQRRTTGRRGAVAVAVGLDDRAQPRACQSASASAAPRCARSRRD